MSRTWKEAFDLTWKNDTDDYDCRGENLTSLEGAPSSVAGSFYVDHNHLDSLKGAPVHVGGGLFCSHNRLISLEGAPSFIGESFFCSNNELTSLKDIHLQIEHIGSRAYFDGNPIEGHVLGLLLISGLKEACLHDRFVHLIINKYLPSKGMESVLLCQEELILAGFDEYAQL